MMDVKRAVLDHPIHPFLAERWSPYGFADRSVSPDDLRSLFEAARWAPSSMNEQPWRFLVATRGDPEAWERMVSCLAEGNRGWAAHAPVLVLTTAKRTFDRNGKPNVMAWHDVGLAAATLTVEATSRGLAVHQMRGILPDRAREAFGIPDDHDVVTAIAIGYPGTTRELQAEYRRRDARPRRRRPLPDLVFGDVWGAPAPFLAPDSPTSSQARVLDSRAPAAAPATG